jgi:phosphatidylserine decarboxylase
LISPADGVVLSIAPAVPPPEIALGEAAVAKIGIFLDIFDVHVTRAPIGGKVAAMRYRKGRFVNASLDKASEENERLAIRVAPPQGPEVVCVLIAGLIARRIVCDLREGSQVAAGQRMGIIRFGSRVDVYCPPPYVPMVVAGQRMVGGETVLADLLAQEQPREGVAQ